MIVVTRDNFNNIYFLKFRPKYESLSISLEGYPRLRLGRPPADTARALGHSEACHPGIPSRITIPTFRTGYGIVRRLEFRLCLFVLHLTADWTKLVLNKTWFLLLKNPIILFSKNVLMHSRNRVLKVSAQLFLRNWFNVSNNFWGKMSYMNEYALLLLLNIYDFDNTFFKRELSINNFIFVHGINTKFSTKCYNIAIISF